MLSLEEIYINTRSRELAALDRISSVDTDEIQRDSDKKMLWYHNETFALYAFFCERAINKCKQHFYVCGRIDQYSVQRKNSRLLDTGMRNISYALLSDNKKLIEDFAKLTHSKYQWMVEHGHSTLIYAMQQVIKEDWERLQWSLNIMATKNQKLNAVLLPDRFFFEGLLNKDEGKVDDALKRLLKDHKKRNKYMGIAQDYISIPALGYAKLAWLKGMEVEINHPLVPTELLPYRPLQNYRDKYDFLSEI